MRPGVGGLVGDRVGELSGVVDLSSQGGVRFFLSFFLLTGLSVCVQVTVY